MILKIPWLTWLCNVRPSERLKLIAFLIILLQSMVVEAPQKKDHPQKRPRRDPKRNKNIRCISKPWVRLKKDKNLQNFHTMQTWNNRRKFIKDFDWTVYFWTKVIRFSVLVLKSRQLSYTVVFRLKQASTIFLDWTVYFWTFSKVIRFSVLVVKSMQLRYTVVFRLKQVPFSLLKIESFWFKQDFMYLNKKTGKFWNSHI